MTLDAAAVRALFRSRFGGEPAAVARAPGRVNLIGEHTDYTEGFVLPVAIDTAVWVALRPRAGGRFRLYAQAFDEASEHDGTGEPLQPARHACWQDYVLGTAWVLREHGHPVEGFEAVILGDVPVGAGLSSSAALCVATGFALARAFALPIDARRLAFSARRVETGFIGLQSGIMDQLASALGRADHALLIDCRTAEARPVRLGLEQRGIEIVVVDSAQRRTLAGSAYNARVAECAAVTEAARRLFPERPITTLRDVTAEDLPALTGVVDGRLFRRARHVVSENARVLAFVDALQRNDQPALGHLLERSHASLRDDYEVSTPELDLLVRLASDLPGVIGARLTGAGFGGCTVNLVQRVALPQFERQVIDRYRAQTGLPAHMSICRPSEGAGYW